MADGRYANGKIYKLVNSVDDEFYVGSTCTSLAKRKNGHKTTAKKKPQPVHQHLNVIGWENVDIVLIEEYPCNNKMELERRERHFIEMLKPSLNKMIPTRTQKEYRAENPDKERERHAKYYMENREKVLARMRTHREVNHDEVVARERERVKAKREADLEGFKAYRREIDRRCRESNREEYNARKCKERKARKDIINTRERDRRANDEAYREAYNARKREERTRRKEKKEAQEAS